jgi:hypothetical protein
VERAWIRLPGHRVTVLPVPLSSHPMSYDRFWQNRPGAVAERDGTADPSRRPASAPLCTPIWTVDQRSPTARPGLLAHTRTPPGLAVVYLEMGCIEPPPGQPLATNPRVSCCPGSPVGQAASLSLDWQHPWKQGHSGQAGSLSYDLPDRLQTAWDPGEEQGFRRMAPVAACPAARAKQAPSTRELPSWCYRLFFFALFKDCSRRGE